MSNRILFLLVFCGLIAPASAQSNFNRFAFNAGGGLGIGRDDVASYVGNSLHAVVGGGLNFSRMFGVDAEYMYYDLDFRPSVIQSQSLPGQSGRMQSVSLDGIVNVPRHLGKWGAYGIFGLGFYDRSVSIKSQQLQSLTPCQPAWRWWDLPCTTGFIPPSSQTITMSSNSKVAGGFNYGGGIAHPLSPHLKLYVEFRYHRAYQSDGKTIVMPITVGLRW